MPGKLTTIVYADDEPDILSVASLSLELVGGLSVITCQNAHEAMEAARRQRPDIVLLDVMMPGLDGPTAMRAMRDDPELAGIPVVLMTARVQPSEVRQYLDAGALGVIAKPFDPMTLSREVEKIWQSRPRT